MTAHMSVAPQSDAVDGGRIAVRIVPSAPKRLRLTSRSLRMSQASTLPAAEFDLTQADSDLEAAGGRGREAPGEREHPSASGGSSGPHAWGQ